MYKVFFNHNVICLTETKKEDDEFDFIIGIENVNLEQKILTWLTDGEAYKVCLVCKDIEESWLEFCSHFKLIDAAGGIVKNPQKEYLFIYRNDFWDLPKGKREKDESIDLCANREIEEECGVSGLFNQVFLLKTYHTYPHKGKIVLKTTYWYVFDYNGHDRLVPQLEEGISRVIWAGKNEVIKCMENTYPSIRDVVMEAGYPS